jgi:hypothetical protein
MELKVRQGYLTEVDDGRCVEWVKKPDALAYAKEMVQKAYSRGVNDTLVEIPGRVAREREEIIEDIIRWECDIDDRRRVIEVIRSRGEAKQELCVCQTETGPCKVQCREGCKCDCHNQKPAKIERLATGLDWTDLVGKVNELVDAENERRGK